MLIDSKATTARMKRSPQAKGIVGELAGELSFAKEEKKLSDEEHEMLRNLVCWLFALGEDERVLQMGELLLQITPTEDKQKWSLIELGLCMPWLLAQRSGDAEPAARCEAKLAEGYATESGSPEFIRQANEKVRLRQVNGEHLHDDEIAQARDAA